MSCGSIGGLAKRARVAYPIVPMIEVHVCGKLLNLATTERSVQIRNFINSNS